MIILILVLLLIPTFFIARKCKSLPQCGTITLCTGAVKTGKSTLAVYLAIRNYRKSLYSYYVSKYLFRRDVEKPLLYSNIPLKCDYVPLTTDVLLRKVRISYKSVVLLDEASLVADSQMIKDGEVNKQLLKFFKLFGHYSKGGSLIIDTQSISDLHYAIKRCINSYIYIERTYKVFPFVLAMKVIEQRYSDDGSIVSTEDSDISERLKTIIVPKRVWKKFDTYCYSLLTDNKPRYVTKIKRKDVQSLKSVNIPSFRDWSDN